MKILVKTIICLSFYFMAQNAWAENSHQAKRIEWVNKFESWIEGNYRSWKKQGESVDSMISIYQAEKDMMISFQIGSAASAAREFAHSLIILQEYLAQKNHLFEIDQELIENVQRVDNFRRKLITKLEEGGDQMTDNLVALQQTIINDSQGKGVSTTGVELPEFPRTELSPEVIQETEEQISITPTLSFQGLQVKSGVTFYFKKRYIVSPRLFAAGNEPIIKKVGSTSVFNQSENRRVVFYCEVTAQSMLGTEMGSGIKFYGIGQEVNVRNWNSFTSSKTSEVRFVGLEKDNGEKYHLRDIINYCSKTYLPVVKEYLDYDLKTMLFALSYADQNQQCLKHRDCYEWHRKLSPLVRSKTMAICATNTKEDLEVRECEARGRYQTSCPLYSTHGKLLSSGIGEYKCAPTLKCEMVSPAKLWFKAKGQCL